MPASLKQQFALLVENVKQKADSRYNQGFKEGANNTKLYLFLGPTQMLM